MRIKIFAATTNPLRLLRKRPALISEAPCGYFGSALRLFRKRLAVIQEAPSAYRGSEGKAETIAKEL